jgi:hypothetical protein
VSDDTQRVATADLKLVLHNTESAARDAQAALEATGRLIAGIGPRFSAIEARIGGIEQRLTAVEASVEAGARTMHRIEQAFGESNFAIQQMLSDILARLP